MSFISDLLTGAFGKDGAAGNLLATLTGLGVAGAGGLLTKEAYDKLEEIGALGMEKGLELGEKGLEQSEFQPFGVTTTTGAMFDYDPVTGQVRMTGSQEEQERQRRAFEAADTMFGAAMAPTEEREAEIYRRMRAAQAPDEERQQLALEERLASQGRLGVQTAMFGGTPEQLAMAKAQAEQRDRAAIRAMEQARGEQMQQLGIGQQMLGAAYLPQQQLLAAQQASQLFPQLQQRGQLYGAGLYGEGVASGLDMLLGSGLGQAELAGNLGTGLLTGLFK